MRLQFLGLRPRGWGPQLPLSAAVQEVSRSSVTPFVFFNVLAGHRLNILDAGARPPLAQRTLRVIESFTNMDPFTLFPRNFCKNSKNF
ncbi:hypothetical protein MATL_G00185480 [Megalops atlanticus]|uniref:Uncharacterized protein n=1 Tax=Megalops atlanticus TaxID=7932 RepID=A0A9D3PKX9_MEGAT|nr:hypothetical protein MATL_G00185480 [Megalops atlanticus]